ncbi:hypothetical protein [Bradyrhizobium guangxiense]|uniref:hypothetical protein n=1 Tax=Bradyrhizobium guangxiense TaxID=1325115 RepID=UPI0010092149|nr:hypothetical protein [Bradyrhizobium guangxiense]
MFQLFAKARDQRLFRRAGSTTFRVRSAKRDSEQDQRRVAAIMVAIDDAIAAAERERAGLSRRVEEVLARPAVTLGNDDDEYLYREPLDSHHQDLFDAEIVNGQRRLKELGSAIAHFRFVRAAMQSRFPDYKSRADDAGA